jgi:histidinol-phosphate phosphatase family protein
VSRPAAFFDRDGTLIGDTGYVRDPNAVSLLPGVGAALRRLNEAGVPVVVITNQSGIARGRLTSADYEAVSARVAELLARDGGRIDATYHCPHHPEFTGPCDCRKPGVLLFQRAAADHGLDLARSVYIGDRWRDVAPAATLGGRGILVPSASTPPDEIERTRADGLERADTIDEAVTRFLATLPARNVGQ